MLVLGAKEAESGKLSVRDRKGETFDMPVEAFVEQVVAEIRERRS